MGVAGSSGQPQEHVLWRCRGCGRGLPQGLDDPQDRDEDGIWHCNACGSQAFLLEGTAAPTTVEIERLRNKRKDRP